MESGKYGPAQADNCDVIRVTTLGSMFVKEARCETPAVDDGKQCGKNPIKSADSSSKQEVREM